MAATSLPETCDFLVVGAGIVGLTVANEIKRRQPAAKIIVLDKEPEVGKHASGRNSGVLHSGVYYGNTTLKAKACVRGAKLMREFAKEHGIRCDVSGKVIIATSERDLPTIDRLMKNAVDNGVRAEKLDEKGVKEIEPHASPYKVGINSPDTAVIDSKGVLYKLRELLEQKGVKFQFDSPLLSVDTASRTARTKRGSISYGFFYNCAGAGADRVAKLFGAGQDYTLVPFKGLYYKLRPEKNHLVRANIYPVPNIDLPFLGVHLTRVVSGDVYVGPTAIPAFGRENYGILEGVRIGESLKIGAELASLYLGNKNNFRLLVHTEIQKYLKSSFVKSAQRLMNELTPDDLVPCDKVGIRPQLINLKTRALEMDYILEKSPTTMHVLNSISPAFTSAFAFAEYIVDQAEKN